MTFSSTLRSVFLCEFDPIAGPTARVGFPRGGDTDSLHAALVEQLGEYLITKPAWCHRLIVSPAAQIRVSSGSVNKSSNLNSSCSDDEYISVRVAGFPVQLDGARYARNFLQFNLCLVFHDGDPEIERFSGAIRRLGRTLETLEVESAFLSTPETKQALGGLLEQLFIQLNGHSGECEIKIDAANTLRLRLPPATPFQASSLANALSERRRRETQAMLAEEAEQGQLLALKEQNGKAALRDEDVPSERRPSSSFSDESGAAANPWNKFLQKYKGQGYGTTSLAALYKNVQMSLTESPSADAWQVPVQLVEASLPSERNSASDINDWDLCLQQIFPAIDGVHCVAKVAERAGVHIDLAKEAMKKLVEMRQVALVDMFSPNNLYCVTPQLRQLLAKGALLAQCLDFTGLRPVLGDDAGAIFRLFGLFGAGKTVRDAYTEVPAVVALRKQRLHVDMQPSPEPFVFSVPAVGHADFHRVVLFGVLNQFIRRLHERPCLLVPGNDARLKELTSVWEVRSALDGTQCLDEIAVGVGKSVDQLRACLKPAIAAGLVAVPKV